jgi:hypothetical protein
VCVSVCVCVCVCLCVCVSVCLSLPDLPHMDITVSLSDVQAFCVRSIVFNDVSNTIPTCLTLDTSVIGSLYKITFRPIECFTNCNNLLFARNMQQRCLLVRLKCKQMIFLLLQLTVNLLKKWSQYAKETNSKNGNTM